MMEYEIIRNEDDGLSVYLPYKNLFNETYNPDGYEEFPEIEIVFKDTEDKEKPSKQQMNALEYFIQHSFELSEFISEYIFNESEVLLEKGFQIEEVKEAKKKYRFSTIYIDDEHKDKFSFIGMTGICSWDEEHGFGVVLFKKEIIDFGDWNCGYTMYSSNKEKRFSLAEENMLEPLTNRRKKITELSKSIEIDNVDDYLSLLKWLIDLKVVYGYRKTKLDLNDKEIIALIQSLEELDLSNKKLESLHENFNLLSNLKELNLSNNNFTELPESLNQLDLQILIFKNNELCNLPQSFIKLKNLCQLFLSDNKFTEAPELLGGFIKLTSLDLSNNSISELPKSYENLSELTYFSIANNKFDLFPEVIKYWKHLQLLYLDNNNLKIIPDWINEFYTLRNLGLSNNKIIKLPSSIGNMNNLGSLYLENNELVKIPEEIGNLKDNCSIHLRNNKLSALPINVQKRKSIYILNNNISEEKLEEYLKWKEHYQNLSENDFNTELSRIRQEKREKSEAERNLSLKNVQVQIQNENDTKTKSKPIEYIKNEKSKSGCLGIVTLFFIIFFFISCVVMNEIHC